MKRPPKEFDAEFYNGYRTTRYSSALPSLRPEVRTGTRRYLVYHADQSEADYSSLAKLGLFPLDVRYDEIRDEAVKDRVLGKRLLRDIQNDISKSSLD
jgi:hypothetical protein